MTVLDVELLRKRSEHNDGLLCDLEEISLHQEEIEKIERIGQICKHLKILLLQNNIISKIENLYRLKELEYLNLALNNISKIENLERCESLRKLDLTLNFIDFDEFESSLRNLEPLFNLEDLYLIGNPIHSAWCSQSYRLFIIGSLPQMRQLDGQLVTPTERVTAKSEYSGLLAEVRRMAKDIMSMKINGSYADVEERAFSRAARIEMYRELGRQKADKELAERRRMGIPDPPIPKEIPSVLNSKGEIRQCNEGGYEYGIDDTSFNDKMIFELHAPKYMDSSIISIDLDPWYIRCVIRNKVTQVRLDEEVNVSKSSVQRSKTTGVIKCVCVYENPRPIRKPIASTSTIEADAVVMCGPPPLEKLSL
jgi:protein TilB